MFCLTDIPPDIPVTALADVKDQSGNYTYPRDTRDGTDHLAGWYRIGSFQKPFPNGLHDFHEANPAFTPAIMVLWECPTG